MKHLPRLTVLLVCLLAWVQPARAETVTVTGANDLWFTFTEPTVFRVRTYAWQNGIDSMLWLYDSSGNLLMYNDDYFGLDSYLEHPVPPGVYRLRTGVCCWDTNRWYGTSYTVELDYSPDQPSTTSTPETSTIPETTTSLPEETTTTWVATTTSTEPTTTTTTTVPVPTVPVTEPPPESSSSTTSAPTTTTSTVGPSTSTTVFSAPTTSRPTTTAPTTTTSTILTSTIPPSSLPTSTTTSAPEPTTPPTSLPPQNEALTSVLADPAVFDDLSETEVQDLIATIADTPLTDEEAEQLSAVLSEAPDEVKAEFEQQVDVFSGQFDTYVPVGSVVPVGTRRTLVAVTATTLVAIPTPTSRRNK